MAIKIVTDSTSDIGQNQGAQLGIEVLPLRVLFGDTAFKDGIDLTNEQFYQMLEKAEQLPTTSQVNPDEFEKVFKKELEAGNTVLGIFLSSKLSGTFQSAVIAKQTLQSDNIYLIDSTTTTVGLSILVNEAIKMQGDGKSIQEIYEKISDMATKVRLIAVVNTLKYLKMGGRINATAAIVGEVLGISPMISLLDGVVNSAGKVRGKKKAYAFMEDFINGNPIDHDYPLGFTNSMCTNDMLNLAEHLKDGGFYSKHFTGDLGAVVGTHAGPGCYGFAYIGQNIN